MPRTLSESSSKMEFDLVIKVKYGDTLRRFTSYVNGGLGVMDLNMVGLWSKIYNSFKLAPDTDPDLTLTYIDEDGDVVTLVDDNDLRDAAINQHLNPLRINVQSKGSKTDASNTRSQSEISATTRSPQVPIEPPSRISAGVEDAFQSVPEPFRNALLKLSNDLISKAASSAPVLTEFVEYYSKLDPLSQSQEDAASSTPRNSSDCAMDLNVTAGFEASNDPVSIPKVMPNANSVDKSPLDNPKGYDCGNTIKAVSSFTPYVSNLMDHNPYYSSRASETFKQSVPQTHDNADVFSGEKNKQSPQGEEPSASQVGFNPQNFCSINSEIGADASDVVPSGGLYPAGYPCKRNYGHYDNMIRTFHRGVWCDGCGMHPIMGPRFKSKVKDDYNLCNICFSEMGNEADYTRIDRATYRSPQFFNPHSRFPSPSLHAIRGGRVKPWKPKLESRFIRDVTILDGTLMAPDTPFTKIWRMRNNGTTVWPAGTRLVWIGGDMIGDRGSVELEIPANGCPVNEELDIAVAFTAPSHCGQYISYWKMASPSGQKFGQRVWVHIQVDTGPDSLSDIFHTGLNLNLPPESNGQKGRRIIEDVNVKPMDGAPFIPDPSNVPAEPVKLVVDEPLIESQGLDFQVDNGSLDHENGVPPTMSEASAPLSYPIIDFRPIIEFSESSSPAAEVPAPSGVDTEGNMVEQNLLKELEEMGFKQTDLNKEILRMNEYNLERSLDELCDVAEWDPILVELQEMGFSDRQMNKKLLIKNGGSIKRVVLDLITGEAA